MPPSGPSPDGHPPQPKPSRRTTSLNPFTSSFITATPDRTVSIKVPRDTLRSSNDSGLTKESFLTRHSRVHALRRRVSVEASIQGTADAFFFAPETPNADEADMRAVPCEFVKVKAEGRDDCVHFGDDFEIEFVGMSVTRQDTFGNNDLLLCSLTRKEEANGMVKQGENKKASMPENYGEEKENVVEDMSGLPSSLRVSPNDIPFIHYDPIYDGHDVGNKPDTFVAMPGTRRLYLQRRGRLAGDSDKKEESPVMYIRFTVMEVDNVSDEQLAAIRSIEEIAGSVQKAAASVPYLKIVSSMLKMADRIGKSAIKRISKPDHVMSVDLGFKLYKPTKEGEGRHEEYGNYLRVRLTIERNNLPAKLEIKGLCMRLTECDMYMMCMCVCVFSMVITSSLAAKSTQNYMHKQVPRRNLVHFFSVAMDTTHGWCAVTKKSLFRYQG